MEAGLNCSEENPPLVVQSDVRIAPGGSGGGLFLKKTGELLGIITFKYMTPVGFVMALPVDWIKADWEQGNDNPVGRKERNEIGRQFLEILDEVYAPK